MPWLAACRLQRDRRNGVKQRSRAAPALPDHVPVPLSHRRALVPQEALHVVESRASGDEGGRGVVAQVVESEVRLRPLAPAELAAQLLRAVRGLAYALAAL